jgi:hypothetical protein
MLTRDPVRVSILAGLIFLVPQALAQKPAVSTTRVSGWIKLSTAWLTD